MIDKHTQKAIDNYKERDWYKRELPANIISILHNASINYDLRISNIRSVYVFGNLGCYRLQLLKSKKENYLLTREEFLSKVVSSLPNNSILEVRMRSGIFSVIFKG